MKKTSKKIPSVTTRVVDACGTGWLVTITDRVPRAGERAVWLHSSLDETLRGQLRSILDEHGRARPAHDVALRLGVLYTYDPDPYECVRGWARLVTIEVEAIVEKAEVQP